MAIQIEKIKEIYGEKALDDLLEEGMYENFEENVLYLGERKIEGIYDVVESYFLIFLNDHEDFKKQVNALIERLGENYIELLSNDMSYWEELM